MNTQKSSVVKGFNSYFQDMFDNILEVYPDNLEIIMGKNTFKTINQFNPTTLIKGWYQFVVGPYHELIEAGNIDFFFEKDYTNDLAYLTTANDVLKIIERVRNPLRDIGEKNMQHIKKYLLNLSKLSILYNQMTTKEA